MAKHDWEQINISVRGEVRYACTKCQSWVEEPEDTECPEEPHYITWNKLHNEDSYKVET